MKRKVRQVRLSALGQQILAYLIEHPQARDTLEGIVQWWVLEQQIKRLSAQVKATLEELVSLKLVIEHKGKDEQVHYSLNSNKLSEIHKLVIQEDK